MVFRFQVDVSCGAFKTKAFKNPGDEGTTGNVKKSLNEVPGEQRASDNFN